MNAHMAARTVPDMWYGPCVLAIEESSQIWGPFWPEKYHGNKIANLAKGPTPSPRL